MKLKQISKIDFSNKRVLMRVDFNVTLDEKGDIKERFKVESCRDSMEHILSFPGVKLALISHLGRPDGKAEEALSMKNITDDLERLFERRFIFISHVFGDKVGKALKELEEGNVILLENVRFWKEEEENDSGFAEKIAKNFDIYINNAFSVSHRKHASVVSIAKFLPSYVGIRINEEIDELEGIRVNPERPAVAVIGGAKIETKLPMIRNFEENYDYILVGGKVANEALDEKINFSEKVVLPVDFQKDRLDIGPKTVEKFKEIISNASTIVWNGPLGKFEEPPYDQGTREIIDAIIESGAFTVTGGGESIQYLEEEGLLDEFSFISTGGGAMLSFMGGQSMPGIDVLKVEE